MIDLLHLPGGEWVNQALADRREGRRSIASLLIALAESRLTELGLPLAVLARSTDEPELALYALLESDASIDDPYYRYNSLRRELDSFIAALEATQNTD